MYVNGRQAMPNRKPSQSWDNLRYFLAVARTGTLSAAAEQLGTEHTTVARHIQALEEELDSRLFHRSNSGYGLTEVGERPRMSGKSQLSSQPKSSLTVLCSLRQRHHRSASRDNMRKNQRL
jgi:predicted ArsR family transcriptional regulator